MKEKCNENMDGKIPGLVSLTGGCHCRRIRFSVQSILPLCCWKCNCSICYMKQNLHFVVPKSHFQLICGSSSLTEYTFNSHPAKHLFCKHCGICSFYIPRSNPDGVAVTVYCLDKGSDSAKQIDITVKDFDGINWEQSISKCNISSLSKL